MIEIEPIGCKPYASSALIIHKNGLVLAVSRKYDFEDFGLPGGKNDAGESTLNACIRETFEETGLTVVKSLLIFGAYCGRPEKHIVHWNSAYLCKVTGKIETSEKGRVAWVTPERLIKDKNGKQNSFSEYNEKLLEKYKQIALQMNVSEYYTDIEIDQTMVDI